MKRKQPSHLSKAIRAVQGFITRSIALIAPYTVYNAATQGTHAAWSFKAALAWVACYDALSFGRTDVYNFNGELVAAVNV